MRIDMRWLVQASAFIGCIYFFINVWNTSKQMIASFSTFVLLVIVLNSVLFLICFFLMAVTSYLKQKNNGTLKNPIPLFEKLLSRIGHT